MDEIIVLFFLFFTKHFFVDFMFQDAYMYKNKGIYGHMGGIIHAVLHGWATFMICIFYGAFYHIPFDQIHLWYSVGILDAIVHYHIDYLKVKINDAKNWQCNTSERFWHLLGLDQYLHYLTYLVIVFMLVHK